MTNEELEAQIYRLQGQVAALKALCSINFNHLFPSPAVQATIQDTFNDIVHDLEVSRSDTHALRSQEFRDGMSDVLGHISSNFLGISLTTHDDEPISSDAPE
jgi:hypothetical protein